MFAKRSIVRGRVQGVFFRATAKEIADALGLKGWTRNLPDGSLEVHTEGGDEESIRAFEEWLHRGPSGAEVQEVIIEDAEDEQCKDFLIVR